MQGVAVDGPALCRMFHQAISGQPLPQRLSFDHDPLFEFQRWQANLRILGIESVRTVPYVPVSQDYASYCTSLVGSAWSTAARDLRRSFRPCSLQGAFGPGGS